MHSRQTLPQIWLLSDARNDGVLADCLRALPPRSGFVFRHYHLAEEERRVTFGGMAMIARSLGHMAVLSDDARVARQWQADGVYGPVERLGGPNGLLRFATAHDGDDIQRANAAGVDGIFLSPVFHTRSHPDGAVLGVQGFQMLAQQSQAAVIALGGMNHARALELDWPRWGAIDGLSGPEPQKAAQKPQDS